MQERMWWPLLLLLQPPLWGGPRESPRGEPEFKLGSLQPFHLLYTSCLGAYYSGDYKRAMRDLEAALGSHPCLRETPCTVPATAPSKTLSRSLYVSHGADLPLFCSLLERARGHCSCETHHLAGPVSRHRISKDVRSDFQLSALQLPAASLPRGTQSMHRMFSALWDALPSPTGCTSIWAS